MILQMHNQINEFGSINKIDISIHNMKDMRLFNVSCFR